MSALALWAILLTGFDRLTYTLLPRDRPLRVVLPQGEVNLRGTLPRNGIVCLEPRGDWIQFVYIHHPNQPRDNSPASGVIDLNRKKSFKE